MFIKYMTLKDGTIHKQFFPLNKAYMGDRDHIVRAKTALNNMVIEVLGPTSRFVRDTTLVGGYYANSEGDTLEVSPVGF